MTSDDTENAGPEFEGCSFFLFTGCIRDQAANQDTLSYLTAQL